MLTMNGGTIPWRSGAATGVMDCYPLEAHLPATYNVTTENTAD